MKIDVLSVFLALLLLPAGSCTALVPCHFHASGEIRTTKDGGTLDRERLITVIETAVKPLGFSSGHKVPYIKEDFVEYSFGGGFSAERITVRLVPQTLQIGLRDYNRNEESELVRRVLD